MIARIIDSKLEGVSNFELEKYELCINRKVHITFTKWWYDQTGDEENAEEGEYWGNVRPCDGSCIKKMQLPEHAVKIIQRFLKTKGEEIGEYKKITPLYPHLLKNKK